MDHKSRNNSFSTISDFCPTPTDTSDSEGNSDCQKALADAGTATHRSRKTPRAGLLLHGWRIEQPLVPASAKPARFCSVFSAGGGALSKTTEFHTRPESILQDVSVPYFCLPQGSDGLLNVDAATLLSKTPLPKGSSAFSSMHIVAGPAKRSKAMAQSIGLSALALGRKSCLHEWPALDAGDVVGEYEAFFRVAGDLILKGADRSSLLVFVAPTGDVPELAIASILGMLPFRGLQVAVVTPKLDYADPLQVLRTTSGLFECDAAQPERMGRCPISAVFGPLGDRTFHRALAPWRPLKPPPHVEEKPAPFKIGALDLPMVTYEGRYTAGISRLASLLTQHFGASLFPVVAVGETVDELGYGSDLLCALEGQGYRGLYFVHASGESYKCPDAYGKPELLKAAASAKHDGKRVVVIAVGGGVNGNTMGTIAAMIGAGFVEVPTTLMHYNDATTSAKKAFSLVKDGQILSKNILGTFYLPQLVYCISETFLTLSSCSVHAAVGEATKTMSMLGNTTSEAGQRNFHNILGGSEFASDFTRIIGTVKGFEQLIAFLRHTRRLKDKVQTVGRAIAAARAAHKPSDELNALAEQREGAREELWAEFHRGLPDASRGSIMAFLTVINEEIIRAKAMFLAYSDPFEKYRALLFEYAHTLGHGVEAFMNGLYRQAESRGLDFENAFRLHGQCVGMSVLWAGEMSRRLGHLEGEGFLAHQSFVYLFNGFGGFDFGPLRRLCDELGVTREDFCEGVLQVVRRDNKRGYCKCAAGSSVDQLVLGRPGCLLRSPDPSAELRYLVEVSEDSQRAVLADAFEGAFDNVLVAQGTGQLSFVRRKDLLTTELDDGGNRIPHTGRAAQELGRLLRRLEECGEAVEEGWLAA